MNQKILFCISLAFLVCSCGNEKVSGGYVDTPNGIQVQVELADSLGSGLGQTTVLLYDVAKWTEDILSGKTPVPDTLFVSNGKVEIPAERDAGQVIIFETDDAGAIMRNFDPEGETLSLGALAKISGKISRNFEAIFIAGTSFRATVGEDGYYRMSKVPEGVHLFLVLREGRLIPAALLDIRAGQNEVTNAVFPCTDGPDFDWEIQLDWFRFPGIIPYYTRSSSDAISFETILSGEADSVSMTWGDSTRIYSPKNQRLEISLNLPKGDNFLRFEAPGFYPACIQILQK